MGAKTWMLVYCAGNPRELLKEKPMLDRDASLSLVKKLFPSDKLKPLEDCSLSYTCPPKDELVIGAFPNLAIVAAREFGLDHPSRLADSFVQAAAGQSLYLHAMHSSVDWFACAIWDHGQLRRSLSLSPDDGVLEDIGARLPFEQAYWAGLHPAVDPGEDASAYPFAFNPLELGEAALLDFFGYQLEGAIDSTQLEPDELKLMRFKRSNPWWRF